MATRMRVQRQAGRVHGPEQPRLCILEGGRKVEVEDELPLWRIWLDALPMLLGILAFGYLQGLLEGIH
ncbi:MAG: hypothetical protein VKO64_07925 [Candidatus Sericytochromatia bacterium]|nr:hypothetical protein [Candidatus Sericytochromatia bacterium]